MTNLFASEDFNEDVRMSDIGLCSLCCLCEAQYSGDTESLYMCTYLVHVQLYDIVHTYLVHTCMYCV